MKQRAVATRRAPSSFDQAPASNVEPRMSSAPDEASQPGFDRWEAGLAYWTSLASGPGVAPRMPSAPGEAPPPGSDRLAGGSALSCGAGLASASNSHWARLAPSRVTGARCSDRASGPTWRAEAAWSPVLKSKGRRQGRSWAWPDNRAAGGRPQARPHALGNRAQKVAPSPGAEITPMDPPCNSTNRLARARPTP